MCFYIYSANVKGRMGPRIQIYNHLVSWAKIKKDFEKINHENLAFTPLQSCSFDACNLCEINYIPADAPLV